MTTTAPLPFSINYGDHRDHTDMYGDFNWVIGLPDGREVHLKADRVEVVAGAVVAWQDSKVTKWDQYRDPIERGPLDKPQANLALPAGAWTHFYAASVLDGSPIVVSHLAAPETSGSSRRKAT